MIVISVGSLPGRMGFLNQRRWVLHRVSLTVSVGLAEYPVGPSRGLPSTEPDAVADRMMTLVRERMEVAQADGGDRVYPGESA